MLRAIQPLVVVLIGALSVIDARADEPVTVTIAGAEKVILTLPGADKPAVWTQTYYAYIDNAVAPLVEEPVVQALQEASGREIEVTPTVSPVVGSRLPDGQPLTIKLTATIDKAGTYTTTLRVSAAKKVATKTITVEVAAAASAPALVEALVQVDKGAKAHEGDDPLNGDKPELVVLTVRNKSKTAVAVSASGLVMTRKTSATHNVDVAAAATDLSVDGQAEDVIPAESTARLQVKLEGLEMPGEYNGLLRLTPTDKTIAPIDLEVAVYLRHSWQLCAALIALGALLAYLIRNAQDLSRIKQVRRIELAAVVARLEDIVRGAATSHAVALGRSLERHVRGVDELIERGDKVFEEAGPNPIKLLGTRVGLYERFVEVDAAVARLPAETRDTKRTALDGVASVIGHAEATADMIENAAAALKDIAARDAVRSWLKLWLKTLEADVTSHAASGDVELSQAITARLEPALVQARAQAKDDALEKLQATLEGVQRDLIDHGALALERALKQAPGGVEAAVWTKLTADLTARLGRLKLGGELQTLITGYGQVRLDYLMAVGRGAVAVADDYLKDAELSTATRDQVKKLRDAVVAACDATAPDAAMITRTTVVLRERLREGGFKIAGTIEGYRPPEMAARPEPESARVVAEHTRRVVSRDWRALQARLQRADLGVFVVVTAIGIAAGLKLLWVGNATWGGWVDGITAFVWGAGVNASKDGFMGLLKLRNDLGKI